MFINSSPFIENSLINLKFIKRWFLLYEDEELIVLWWVLLLEEIKSLPCVITFKKLLLSQYKNLIKSYLIFHFFLWNDFLLLKVFQNSLYKKYKI